MSSTFKLNDPHQAAYNQDRLAFYASRARESLAAEQVDAPQSVIDALATIAADHGAGTDAAEPDVFLALERTVLQIGNNVTVDAQRIKRALVELSNAVEDAGVSTRLELVEGLEKNSIVADELTKTLSTFHRVVSDMASVRTKKLPKGEVASKRRVCVLASWRVIAALAVGLRPASRVIAMLLDGNSSRAGAVFTALERYRPDTR